MTSTHPQAPARQSERKHTAILEAAETAFLRDGYLGTNMDEIASSAGVSKPTIYRHFGTKEGLFLALVTDMTTRAGDGIHEGGSEVATIDELRACLTARASKQLATVLTPRLTRVRRLVIGEVSRFPELAKALNDAGPQRAIAGFTELFAAAHDQGLLEVPDPATAAEHFNWLVMGGPVNRAMLLGDDALPSARQQAAQVRSAVEVILAAYRAPEPPAAG